MTSGSRYQIGPSCAVKLEVLWPHLRARMAVPQPPKATWNTQSKGSALWCEGSGDTRQRRWLSHEDGGNTKERHCLIHEGSGNTKTVSQPQHEGSGNTQGKGSVM